MLEIILLFFLGRKISEICKSKGRAGWPFVILFVLLWFGCELGGAVVGVIITGGREDSFLTVWLCGLAGAAVGATIGFLIVNALPSAVPEVEEDLGSATQEPPQKW